MEGERKIETEREGDRGNKSLLPKCWWKFLFITIGNLGKGKNGPPEIMLLGNSREDGKGSPVKDFWGKQTIKK